MTEAIQGRFQMTHRCSMSALAASALAVAMFAIPAAAQTTAAKPAAAVKTKTTIPRTADGHPDLSGVYTTATAVPVTRPAYLGAKEFYKDEADRQESAARGRGAAGG